MTNRGGSKNGGEDILQTRRIPGVNRTLPRSIYGASLQYMLLALPG